MNREHGRTPTNEELATTMKMDIAAVLEIISYTQGIASLDSSLAADDELTPMDALQVNSATKMMLLIKIYAKSNLKLTYGTLWNVTRKKERV